MNKTAHFLIALLTFVIIFRCDLQEPEQEEPEVSIKCPSNNSFVCEVVTITAEASDNKGVVYVEFYIDGETSIEMRDKVSPYTYEWNVLNLPDSSSHTIYAKATDTDDNISSSKMITVVINNSLALPEPVTIETPATVTDSSVTLKWSENTNEDFRYFSIFRDTTTGVDFNSNHIVTIYEDTVVQYTDFNVLENMSYNYVIYIFDDYNFYSKSNEVSANIPNRKPVPVTLYNPTNITDSSMTIMWSTSQIHDFQKYCLYRSLSDNPDNTSNVVFETSDKYENMFTDTELETNTVYFYRLGIYDTGHLFSLSNIVSDTAKTRVSQIPIEGLLAFYSFRGSANDESGNSNNGTIHGATLTEDRFSNPNNAYNFDGFDDYISISHNNELNPTSITISAWVYLREYPPQFQLSTIINNGAFINEEAWELLIRTGENSSTDVMVQFDYTGNKGQNSRICAAGLSNTDLSMVLYRWYHVVGMYDTNSETASIYCDRTHIKKVTGNPGPITNNNNDFWIGCTYMNKASNRHEFNGIIDDIRIYNRALSESEIQKLYHEN